MLVADRYLLTASLGRGAMGEVWRATDEVLGREVAVKLLLPTSPDGAARERFRREAMIAGRLSHPNVVAVHDFGYHESHPYLILELVTGASLADRLEKVGALPPREVRRIAGQVAAGLAEAHRHGVVHRDIKPGNLLVTPDGTVKLADFGIARLDETDQGLTQAGLIVGTSYYLAPERAMAQAAGPASDMYSLGCVLYQLMTGHVPFTADNTAGVIYQHVHTPPVPPGELRPEFEGPFENYLLRLLAKEPEDRPTASELAEWARNAATVPEPVVVQAARKRKSLLAIATMGVGVAVAAALMLDPGGRVGSMMPEDSPTPTVTPVGLRPGTSTTKTTTTPRPKSTPTPALARAKRPTPSVQPTVRPTPTDQTVRPTVQPTPTAVQSTLEVTVQPKATRTKKPKPDRPGRP
ncbi:serine/threonine protein kinase [Kribbella sp. NBC_01245]|uniref:serine/threonine-protein kinase n=1 Tax=Kribbella sp. NBC_01245 TaxID=2903578 RepID=UPI002E2B5DD6|nr:serine/threonine-protein kinase [Kribbella sp. NBC_01245]